MAIGQRIKYFRNRIGMTQKQLGKNWDLREKPQMSAWLNMNQKPEFQKLIL